MSSPSVPSEASQLAILDSDASVHDKAVACQRLVYVAGPKSVPALAVLLDHEPLADYARSGLEAIDDPAASKALLDALPKLKGLPLAGAVNSLGVRREADAIPVLQKLVVDPARGVQAEAIASLGMIGTPEVADTLAGIVTKGPDDLRTAAGHASLVAATHLAKAGEKSAAAKLLKALMSAFPQGPVHDGARHLAAGA